MLLPGHSVAGFLMLTKVIRAAEDSWNGTTYRGCGAAAAAWDRHTCKVRLWPVHTVVETILKCVIPW